MHICLASSASKRRKQWRNPVTQRSNLDILDAGYMVCGIAHFLYHLTIQVEDRAAGAQSLAFARSLLSLPPTPVALHGPCVVRFCSRLAHPERWLQAVVTVRAV